MYFLSSQSLIRYVATITSTEAEAEGSKQHEGLAVVTAAHIVTEYFLKELNSWFSIPILQLRD